MAHLFVHAVYFFFFSELSILIIAVLYFQPDDSKIVAINDSGSDTFFFNLYFPPFSLLHPFVSNNEHEAPETASSTGACRSPLRPSTCLPLSAVRGCGAPYNLASLMTPKTGVEF